MISPCVSLSLAAGAAGKADICLASVVAVLVILVSFGPGLQFFRRSRRIHELNLGL